MTDRCHRRRVTLPTTPPPELAGSLRQGGGMRGTRTPRRFMTSEVQAGAGLGVSDYDERTASALAESEARQAGQTS
jgi:hypothetical protein